MNRHAIGIDIGGSSIKCARVDLDTGQLASERRKTPSPALSAVQDMYAALASVLPPDTDALAAGVAFPGVIKAGVVKTAAHIAQSWLDHPLTSTAATHLGRDVVALNDADAAGLAEMRYGAGRDVAGTALVLTLGTGIGSALFVDGHLVPNTELGHLEVDGTEAELRAAARIRVEHDLDWNSWLRALELVINRMHSLLWPDLVVLCGGITADHPQLARELVCHCPIKVGELRADAGLVGAALATTLSRGAWLQPQANPP